MANVNVADPKALAEAVEVWLEEFPGDLICARQIWYEGLGGEGIPTPDQVVAIEEAISALRDWEKAGSARYEKFGMQYSFRREQSQRRREAARDPLMVQHLFKVGSLYQTPEGTVYKIVLSEVYNLRCFEIRNGKMVGGMVKIHPLSDLANSLKEVV